MKRKFCLIFCLSAISLFSNDKVVYSQLVDTEKNEANVIIKEGEKETRLFDNLLVIPNESKKFTVKPKQFTVKIKGKEYDLTFDKTIDTCEQGNEKLIDKTHIVYSIVNNKQVVGSSIQVVELKTGYEINLDLCKTEKNENGYYVNLNIRRYSVDTSSVSVKP